MKTLLFTLTAGFLSVPGVAFCQDFNCAVPNVLDGSLTARISNFGLPGMAVTLEIPSGESDAVERLGPCFAANRTLNPYFSCEVPTTSESGYHVRITADGRDAYVQAWATFSPEQQPNQLNCAP